MEEVYALHQHEYSIAIHLSKQWVHIAVYEFKSREIYGYLTTLSERACIIYNRQTQTVSSWGEAAFKAQENEFDIRINNFIDGLDQLFKKDKKEWNEVDIFFHNAVSDFLSLAIEKLMKDERIVNKNLDLFHYVFIVSSEWEEEIRENLIRPIFIQVGLLSKDDHKDRLLFISDVECICYKESYLRKNVFERGQNIILFRCAHFEDETIWVKLDLVKTVNTLFDFPDSILYPKVYQSNSFYINLGGIKDSIKTFLKKKLLIDDNDNDQDKIVQNLVELIYNRVLRYQDYFLDRSDEEAEIELMEPCIPNVTELVLNDSQKIALNAISLFNIRSVISKQLMENIKTLLSNNFSKQCKFLIHQYNPFSEIELKESQIYLLQFMFEFIVIDLNNIIILNSLNCFLPNQSNLAQQEYVSRPIQDSLINSEMYSAPRITPTDNLIPSSSVYTNSRPDAIINIDISLKSTVILHSLLNEDGSIKESFVQNCHIADKWSPSLEEFYNVSNSVILKLGEKFILFADEYLLDDFNYSCVNQEFLSKVEEMMTKNYCNLEKVSSIYHRKYIEAFFLMYLIYLKELISSKLSIHTKSNNTTMKIGYAISIEKLLLNKIIGNKEDLQQLVYKSGLVNKDDENTKLRIITQGEGILSIIQPMFKLSFPVRSYFVLAQLHEDYIQLTLNQVVTKSSLEEEQQEAIIIKDKIITVQNIYDSLCLNMWSNLVEGSSLIELCHIHNKNCNDHEISNLFTLESRNMFIKSLKEFISNDILNSNSNLENVRKRIINLSQTCNCKVHIETIDIINVCFKPVLQNIHAIMMFSLINEDIFGEYNYIQYMFSLIHFTSNPQFQKIISTIFNEETYYSNPKRGIDTSLMVLPKIQDEGLQSVHKLHLFFYKGFKIGTLHQQICNRNYGIVPSVKTTAVRIGSTYGKKRVDTKAILEDSIFTVFKKEDILSDTELNYVLYFDITRNDKYFVSVKIDLFSYEFSDILHQDEEISVEENSNYTHAKNFSFNLGREFTRGIPVVFTVEPIGHMSSLRISTRQVGRDPIWSKSIEIGNPMTLCRT